MATGKKTEETGRSSASVSLINSCCQSCRSASHAGETYPLEVKIKCSFPYPFTLYFFSVIILTKV
jgi:hypothetical protein